MDLGIRLVGSRIAPHGNAHVCAHAAGVPCARSRALSPFRFNRSRRLVLTPNPHSHSRALACIRSDVGAESRRNPAMEQLIATVNKLQDVFAVLGTPSTVDLPQIAVIGSYVAREVSEC